MKPFLRTALLGAAGLVLVSLPAQAMSSTAAQDTSLLNAMTAPLIKMAQRTENPGGGGFRNENPGGGGFRNENPGGGGFRNENPGGGGYKAKGKKKKHKKKHKM
jgi:hypothetical protein